MVFSCLVLFSLIHHSFADYNWRGPAFVLYFPRLGPLSLKDGVLPGDSQTVLSGNGAIFPGRIKHDFFLRLLSRSGPWAPG